MKNHDANQQKNRQVIQDQPREYKIKFLSESDLVGFQKELSDPDDITDVVRVSKDELRFTLQNEVAQETLPLFLTDWIVKDVTIPRLVYMICQMQDDLLDEELIILVTMAETFLYNEISDISNLVYMALSEYLSHNSYLNINAFIKFNLSKAKERILDITSTAETIDFFSASIADILALRQCPDIDIIHRALKAKYVVFRHLGIDMIGNGSMRVGKGPGGVRISSSKTFIDNPLLESLGLLKDGMQWSPEELVTLGYVFYAPHSIILYNIPNSENIAEFMKRNHILFESALVQIWNHGKERRKLEYSPKG